MTIRQDNWNAAENKNFDVAIIGAGINGASVYKRLRSEGYKVVLLDKHDFSSGSSQSSAMMIWGGLLYLKNFDLASVYRFSKDRDALISAWSREIDPQWYRYVPNAGQGRNRYLVYLALHFYWLLGHRKRKRPGFQQSFDEQEFINYSAGNSSLVYEEGFFKQSDARFVLDWILTNQSEDAIALNYCAIRDGEYDHRDRQWSVTLSDVLSGRECTIKAGMVLNCAGVWADSVNDQFKIRTPYKHVFSKGVFVGFARPETHHTPLIFEMGRHGDTLTLVPWGPVSLWGPTETMVETIEDGYSITPEDVAFLSEHASKHLRPGIAASRPVSFRCGIRPLAVKKSFQKGCYPLDISRHHRIFHDTSVPWISVYGGKISGCLTVAEQVVSMVQKTIRPTGGIPDSPGVPCKADKTTFPGLKVEVPSADWCVQKEFCCTLEDYLRRRTNISQWIPREGLGFDNENKAVIEQIAARLPVQATSGTAGLDSYMSRVSHRFDRLAAAYTH